MAAADAGWAEQRTRIMHFAMVSSASATRTAAQMTRKIIGALTMSTRRAVSGYTRIMVVITSMIVARSFFAKLQVRASIVMCVKGTF